MKITKKAVSAVIVFAMLFSMFSLFPVSTEKAYAATGTYWIKVNKQENTATAYKWTGDSYEPVRAMLVSCGGSNTPSGTFYTKGKYRWKVLMDNVWGQYSTRITGSVLFHSVWYYQYGNKASQSAAQFNKLGRTASHGCVRLSVMDAKWIYDKCSTGTKVTIYSSGNPGPLGKPKALKVSTTSMTSWDPTDPDSSNPKYSLRRPVIKISDSKLRTVKYGSAYKLKNKVTAKDPNTYQDLTGSIKVTVGRYIDGKIVKSTFSTKKIGKYRITYKVNDPYSGTASKSMTLRVQDLSKPKISAKEKRYIVTGSTNAVKGMKASQKSASRTSKAAVYIKAPGGNAYKKYSYGKARNFKFKKEGTYYIRYEVSNKYSKSIKAKKSVKVYSYKDAQINVDTSKIQIKEGDGLAIAKAQITAAVIVKDGKSHKGSVASVTLDKSVFKAGETVKIFLKYKGRNQRIVKKTVVVTVAAKEAVSPAP